jgi:UDPglucose 6-dehydrogenase
MADSVSIIGLGKLGAPMAACFAARGFRVHAVDVDLKKVDAINRGLPPVHEPGLAELLQESRGNLRASQDVEAAVRDSDVTFVIVSTPSEPNGGFSLKYVLPCCERIGSALGEKRGFHVVVLTSTVMPGSTGSEVRAALEKASGKRCGGDFGLCYSPEFIALGTVIRDFYYPDFLLIGESDNKAGDTLQHVYKGLCKNSPAVARMNFINAEITKIALNTFITTKISYANMLARLCERLPEADVNVVTGALGLDSRIGSKYLKGAVSYGGPCFPRDNRAFASLAAHVGAFSDLAETTDRFNRAQVKWIAEIVKQHRAGTGPIGVLGLTYKPDTDVVEESFGLLLSQTLAGAGLPVVVYDPEADASRALASHPSIQTARSAEDCINRAEVVILATPWAEFSKLSPDKWNQKTVIDCWGALAPLEHTAGVRYVRLGWGGLAKHTVESVSTAR